MGDTNQNYNANLSVIVALTVLTNFSADSPCISAITAFDALT
jgi:hypothetical protein